MNEPPVLLVTGSGKKRVGNVVARELARDGYRIALHYRSSQQEAQATVAELQRQGVDADAFAADLRSEDDIVRMVKEVHETFGRIDALVCSAASWLRCPLEQTGSKELSAEWETNAQGTLLCCKYVGLVMCEQEAGGAIVTIGDWAIARPYTEHAAYFASKGAIPVITRTMAVELAARNPRVRVNGILPGPVMMPESVSREEREKVIQATLVKREGTPEHVAHAVRFLLENDFVTGVCIPVDGGRSVYAGGL